MELSFSQFEGLCLQRGQAAGPRLNVKLSVDDLQVLFYAQAAQHFLNVGSNKNYLDRLIRGQWEKVQAYLNTRAPLDAHCTQFTLDFIAKYRLHYTTARPKYHLNQQ